MNSLLLSLLGTTESSLLLGFGLATCLVTCVLCFIFYFKFRHKALLNLCFAILAFQFMMIMYEHRPTQLLALSHDEILKRVTHFSGGLIIYTFYRLFVSGFTAFPRYRFLDEKFYRGILAVALIIRAAGLIYPTVLLFRLASYSNLVFYFATLILALKAKSSDRTTLMLRWGCGLGVFGLSIYPLVRTGLFPSEYLQNNNNYILITTITVFSILSLIGALEIGRNYLDRAEKASLRNMARAFIQLRDLMNTPFQTIDLSVELIKQRHPEEQANLKKIENSLDRLRQVDAALAKYESNVDWSQTDDFIALEPESKNHHDKTNFQ